MSTDAFQIDFVLRTQVISWKMVQFTNELSRKKNACLSSSAVNTTDPGPTFTLSVLKFKNREPPWSLALENLNTDSYSMYGFISLFCFAVLRIRIVDLIMIIWASGSRSGFWFSKCPDKNIFAIQNPDSQPTFHVVSGSGR